MGAVQLGTGSAMLIVPLVAAGMLATVGLEGIIIIDILTFVVALACWRQSGSPRCWARSARSRS